MDTSEEEDFPLIPSPEKDLNEPKISMGEKN